MIDVIDIESLIWKEELTEMPVICFATGDTIPKDTIVYRCDVKTGIHTHNILRMSSKAMKELKRITKEKE